MVDDGKRGGGGQCTATAERSRESRAGTANVDRVL